MNEATICPYYFLPSNQESPNEIEIKYLDVILNAFKKCEENSISIVFPANLLYFISTNFPYSYMDKPEWTQYINLWIDAILSPLGKIDNKYNYEISRTNYNLQCNINISIKQLWTDFLHCFKNDAIIIKNKYIKGIFTENICSDLLCQKFILLNNDFSYKFLIYPWLILYNDKLPTEGEYQFIPKNNWYKSAKPFLGKNHGFLDKENNEWCKDRERRDHWDVEFSDGTHVNVNYQGSIIN